MSEGVIISSDNPSMPVDIPHNVVVAGGETLAAKFEDAIHITQSLFPGEMRIEVEDDPELAEHSFIVFHVNAEGELRDIITRRMDWHEKIGQVIPDHAQRLKLSVDVKSK